MKEKVVVSLVAVTGFAVLSATAFLSTVDTVCASPPVRQKEELNAIIFQEKVAIKERGRRLQIESFLVPEPAEEPLQPERENQRSKEDYLLAQIAMAEAEGEDTEGKALVMLVVLNRVEADEFPDSVENVIYQAEIGRASCRERVLPPV